MSSHPRPPASPPRSSRPSRSTCLCLCSGPDNAPTPRHNARNGPSREFCAGAAFVRTGAQACCAGAGDHRAGAHVRRAGAGRPIARAHRRRTGAQARYPGAAPTRAAARPPRASEHHPITHAPRRTCSPAHLLTSPTCSRASSPRSLVRLFARSLVLPSPHAHAVAQSSCVAAVCGSGHLRSLSAHGRCGRGALAGGLVHLRRAV